MLQTTCNSLTMRWNLIYYDLPIITKCSFLIGGLLAVRLEGVTVRFIGARLCEHHVNYNHSLKVPQVRTVKVLSVPSLCFRVRYGGRVL